jgi:transcriptional regulator with XRE-family HTH domain
MNAGHAEPPGSEGNGGVQLGKRLREVREYLGFSQQMVADRTGVARSAISDIERGARKVDSLELKKLARLYRRPVGYFLDERPDATAGDHAIAGLARALAQLTEGDREAVVSFAEYLRDRRAAEQEAAGQERDG